MSELTTLGERARNKLPYMVDRLRDLAAIESPSSDADAVRHVVDHLAPWMERLGGQVHREPVEDAGPILQATFGDRPRRIMLLGHTDTVWPIGTLEQMPIHIEDGKLFGPGVFDMKGGLVVGLTALELLEEQEIELDSTIEVLFTPLEETDTRRYLPYLESRMQACDAVLGLEPAWPGGDVKTARKGTGQFELTIFGRPAHAGARLEDGASAVVELGHKILELNALNENGEGSTCNVGVVRGGTFRNVVAARAVAEIDIRFKTLEAGNALCEQIRSLGSMTDGVRVEIEGGMTTPPLERTETVLKIFEKTKRAAEKAGVRIPGEAETGGASEASFAAALGVPTIDGLGPDGNGAHATDEHVIIDSLADRAAMLAALIRELSRPEA